MAGGDVIMVTGACGAIGGHVVRRLDRLGHRVVAFDQIGPSRAIASLDGRVPLVIGHVDDLGSILDAVRAHRVTRIIHLARVASPLNDEHPGSLYQVDFGGSVNVLEAARLAGVARAALASSYNIYPRATEPPHGHPTYAPVAEEHPPAPGRPYAIFKWAMEQVALTYARRFDLEVAMVRFSTYYGPERAIRRGTRAADVLNRMILNALEGQPTVVPQGGDQGFDAVYVKDCAQGAVAACLAPSVPSRIYNIGSGAAVTLRDAAQAVRRLVPGAQIEVGPGLEFNPGFGGHYIILDISRARREIGYAPEFDLTRGIADCMEELRTML
ncbi:MAG: NAD(P)-dependent oxidoreductase [Armatimonadetes bacterium]|nr:NAD(P)-dependent oxidoreductase [Armatimonadota bacterium]